MPVSKFKDEIAHKIACKGNLPRIQLGNKGGYSQPVQFGCAADINLLKNRK